MYWDAIPQVSGSDFSTGNATLTDITGLTFAAAANTKYDVEGMLLGQSSDTAGVQFAVAFSGVGAVGSYMAFSPSTSSTSSGGVNQLGTAVGVTVWTSATTDLHTFIRSVVSTGANTGNITIQIKKITSGTATVFAGSIMKVRKL